VRRQVGKLIGELAAADLLPLKPVVTAVLEAGSSGSSGDDDDDEFLDGNIIVGAALQRLALRRSDSHMVSVWNGVGVELRALLPQVCARACLARRWCRGPGAESSGRGTFFCGTPRPKTRVAYSFLGLQKFSCDKLGLAPAIFVRQVC
jgi:hypothetical protein